MSKTITDYPLNASGPRLARLTFKDWRKKQKHTRRWRKQIIPDLSHHVNGLERLSQIHPDDVVILTRQRNGMRFVRSLLRHYRSFGADKFVFIDENSTDGSLDLLADQPDVITLSAATIFARSNRGKNWLDAVLTALPVGQRVILIDNDEYLVFSDGTRSFQDLFDAMSRRRIPRLCTIMLDLYPPRPIAKAVFDGSTDQLPWEVAPLFDPDGYQAQNTWQGPRITGGVRQRVFDETLYLTKFPAFFNLGRPIFEETIHFPQPLTHNKGPVGGILLHFKYFSDFVKEHQQVVARGVHNKGGQTYQAVLDQLDGVDVANSFDFTGPTTRHYTNPEHLCELGLMLDICGSSR